MKLKTIFFYVLIGCHSILLLLLFLKVIPIQIDQNSLILLFGFIALSLLPFADKLKIGTFLEFERVKEKIEEVEKVQYLGEVLSVESSNEFYYYDKLGLHKIPDEKTLDFIKTNKGVLEIKNSEYKKLKKGYDLESVKTAKLLKDEQGTVFVILNGKKHYVSSWSFVIDWQRTGEDVKTVEIGELRSYPSAK